MSANEVPSNDAARSAAAAGIDMKLEVVIIPVSDVDRAKEFYERIGWRLNIDRSAGEDFRLVQFTPPGSCCSGHFGKNVTSAAPGSAKAFLIVSDIVAARDQLVAAGEFFHDGPEGRNGTLNTEVKLLFAHLDCIFSPRPVQFFSLSLQLSWVRRDFRLSQFPSSEQPPSLRPLRWRHVWMWRPSGLPALR